MSDDTPADALVRSLCDQARTLAAGLRGPLARIAISAGDHHVEVVWQEHAGGPVAVAGRAEPVGDGGTEAEPAEEGHAIVAPLVGTFYRSPDPNAKPFVEEGDTVEEGADVAIIEAMKIMNRVQADRSGTVVKILVDDAEMVEFGQTLMLIEPLDGGS